MSGMSNHFSPLDYGHSNIFQYKNPRVSDIPGNVISVKIFSLHVFIIIVYMYSWYDYTLSENLHAIEVSYIHTFSTVNSLTCISSDMITL